MTNTKTHPELSADAIKVLVEYRFAKKDTAKIHTSQAYEGSFSELFDAGYLFTLNSCNRTESMVVYFTKKARECADFYLR